MNYIDIGTVPSDERCAQLGVTPDFPRYARMECKAYIEALRKKYGDEPTGARLSTKGNAHNYGTYYEVVCNFDPSKPAASKYAYKVEDGLDRWQDVGMTAPVRYEQNDPTKPVIAQA